MRLLKCPHCKSSDIRLSPFVMVTVEQKKDGGFKPVEKPEDRLSSDNLEPGPIAGLCNSCENQFSVDASDADIDF